MYSTFREISISSNQTQLTKYIREAQNGIYFCTKTHMISSGMNHAKSRHIGWIIVSVSTRIRTLTRYMLWQPGVLKYIIKLIKPLWNVVVDSVCLLILLSGVLMCPPYKNDNQIKVFSNTTHDLVCVLLLYMLHERVGKYICFTVTS